MKFISATPVCTDNMVYTCLGCPSTCKDYRMGTCVEPDECNYGCGCPDGEVMNEENNCIKIVNCPCYNENGVILHENFTVPKEGSECEEWLVSNYTFQIVALYYVLSYRLLERVVTSSASLFNFALKKRM